MRRATHTRRRALLDDLRSRAFRLDGKRPSPARFGLEVELLPFAAGQRRPASLDGDDVSTLRLVSALAAERGWRRATSTAGAPEFRIPGGGFVTFEPGGQIEYSSAAAGSVDAVTGEVERMLVPLLEAFADAGVELLARGIDPRSPPEAVRRELKSSRYRRMSRHLESIGPAGRRMMLQTAALHVNLDLGAAPLRRWWVANALTPYVIAIFANSSVYDGEATGYRSFRAQQWRELDPRRSGVFPGEEPVEEYLRFALDADAILMGPEGEDVRPYRSWIQEGPRDDRAWALHLSTLFPEVRPRGYLEIRSADALPFRWMAAPVVFLAGILYDDGACRKAADLLEPATDRALVEAGRDGVRDPTRRRTALELWKLALAGAGRLDAVGEEALETARAFRDRYTDRGKDLAGDPEGGRV